MSNLENQDTPDIGLVDCLTRQTSTSFLSDVDHATCILPTKVFYVLLPAPPPLPSGPCWGKGAVQPRLWFLRSVMFPIARPHLKHRNGVASRFLSLRERNQERTEVRR